MITQTPTWICDRCGGRNPQVHCNTIVNVHDAMDLRTEYLALLRGYLDGRTRACDIILWLAAHVQVVADTQDQDLDAITGEGWLLLSEFDANLRDQASVRDGFREMLEDLESRLME